MKKTILLLSLICCISSAFTDPPLEVSVMDILYSVHQEQRIRMNEQALAGIQKANYDLPFIREVGLRYGSDELALSQNQYAASIGFNSFKVRKAQSNIKDEQLKIYQAKRDMVLGQVIMERYTNITDAYFTQHLLEKQATLRTLLQQKNELLTTSLKKGIKINIKDLVETEDDIKKLELVTKKWNHVRNLSHEQIKKFVHVRGDIEVVYNDFIEIDQLKKVLKKISFSKQLLTPELRVKQNKIGLSEAELKLEEADFKQYFKNVQLVYENRQNAEFFAKDFSFRVGFNIPIKGNLNPKKSELFLEIKNAENDYFLERFKTENAIKNRTIAIENLIEQYDLSQQSLQSCMANTILNDPTILETLAPIDIIDLKIIQQQKAIEAHQLYYEVVKNYLELLALNGDITLAPYKNYLSNKLEKWIA